MNIPIEILILIFLKLDKKTRKSCKLVCHKWLELLMTCFEFNEDRFVSIRNHYSFYTPLIQTFLKSKYRNNYTFKHLTFKFKLGIDNEVFEDNCINDILQHTLPIQCIYIKADIYFSNLSVKMLKRILTTYNFVKSLRVNCDIFDKFNKIDTDFGNIENLIVDNTSDMNNNFFQKHISKIFPNLKTIHFDIIKCSKNSFQILNHLSIKVTINRILLTKEFFDEPNLPTCNTIISSLQLHELDLDKIRVNERLELHITEPLTLWNENWPVEFLVFNWVFSTSFPNKIHNGYSVKSINIIFKASPCYITLRKFVKSFSNITSIEIKSFVPIDINKLLLNLVKYCKKLKKITYSACNFQATTLTEFSFNYSFESVIELTLYMEHECYKNQLTNINKCFPNLEKIILHLKQCDDNYLLFDDLLKNDNLKKIKIYIKCFADHSVTREFFNLVTKNGSKLRVSIFFINLIFFLITLFLFRK